ncbi:mucoidy inhibitor MuiA family protein [Chryseobacterium sp. GMJ5]|uniref:Mucoidy inhibitor MuiA family protein n=1 Tax=Chryseobacterium gilvum TaxID=2976534 RepID=A0ABT2VT43_9FLAO|nr:mucoidy inhibitor MuiA family protein [Chryseobacterium gilvum]MCU7613166.1 mucoidy inhibitor MuiA family protein [Chryseobacterium gilvum]
MRHYFLIFIFSFSFFKSQEIRKEIEVKQATVFLQGAKVFGSTQVNLQKGRNIVKIINLPNDLDENTYKINLEKSTTLLSITPQSSLPKGDELSEEEKKLDDERKKLQRQAALLNIQINNLTGEQNIINDNLKVSTNDRATPQEQLIKLTSFYRKRMLEIDNQIFLLNEQKSVFDEGIAKINKQFSDQQTDKNKIRKELLLEILADREMSLDLGISYIVSNAGWVPSYDLRAESTKKPFEIVYKGKIYQRTGQDWNNVKLFVSTYKPSYNQNRPILLPLYVAEYTPYNYDKDKVGYDAKKVSEEVNSYQMRDVSVVASQVPVATVSDSQMNVLYELNYKQSIVSQDKEQYVILDKKSVDATYKYHTVPKLNNQVFLMAFVKNWQTFNLISGEANIYFEDNYIGKTNITSNYIKDEFPISLGVDERIVVKRTKIEDKTAQKNFNTNKWDTESYQITIRNNTKESIELEILDQLPISENSKITVKTLNIGDGILDAKTGSILWNRKINSGDSEKINFSFEVRYPKEMQIQYYNR